MKPHARRCAGALTLALAGLAAPRVAKAADCGPVGHGPVVYVAGTAKNYLAALARALFADSTPITIIWRGLSSCDAMDTTLSNTPLAGQGTYWDPSSPNAGNEVTCDLPLPDAGVITADVSISDIFAETCNPLPNGLPTDVGDFLGPVQTMTFVVPKASSQKSISATAAYFVYGFGGDSGVAPWVDGNQIFRLDDASGTQRILAAGIGVGVEKWKGVNLGYSAMMLSTLQSVPAEAADRTIGILAATNIVGTVTPNLSVLAFKHIGQQCAYYPDSTESSHDKRNVRDGHYALWAPIHILTKIDSKGYPKSADALRVINYLTGTTPPPGGLDLIEVAALNNLVPTCAMKVQRHKEMGTMSAFAPTNPCNCYFELKATGATSCQICSIASDCPASAPVCSFGYCESP